MISIHEIHKMCISKITKKSEEKKQTGERKTSEKRNEKKEREKGYGF